MKHLGLMLILVVSIQGCSTITREDVGFHVLNAVDAYQTIQIGKNAHCMHERNPITKKILTESPKESHVIPYFIAVSVGYQWFVHKYRDKPWIKYLRIVTIGKSIGVVRNTQLINRGC